VLAEVMEEEVVDVVGERGKHDPERTAVRHGHESGEVTLGGRRVGIERPRVSSADGRAEVRLRTYEYFADRDPLTRSVLERMLAGVSTRRYRRTQEPVGSEVEQAARSTSKSSVSRTFVGRTRGALSELMSRRLDDVRLAVMMIDGLELQGRTNVVALGITTEGVKIPLGLWEGSTENATVATALLSDLVERGLDPEQGILFVIDGAKALRKAIRNVFGQTPVQRCVRHKERNVLDHLPERDRPGVKQRLRRAWALDDHNRALDQLRALAGELDRSYPGAAGSLREGMDETLTLTRLGVRGNLKRTLESTNPCESMLEIVRHTQRNVKRWSSARWRCAGPPPACSKPNGSFERSATATSPPSSSRSNTTTSSAVTPRLPAPRPRRRLCSSLPDRHSRTAAENPRRAGHPRGRSPPDSSSSQQLL
jgi:transposase-like protein